MRLLRLTIRKIVSAVIAAAYAFAATDDEIDDRYLTVDPVIGRFIELHIALWEDEMA